MNFVMCFPVTLRNSYGKIHHNACLFLMGGKLDLWIHASRQVPSRKYILLLSRNLMLTRPSAIMHPSGHPILLEHMSDNTLVL